LCEALPGGDCTLREAINSANNDFFSPSRIAFDIPTDGSDPGCVSGVCTIALDNAQGVLPQIVRQVYIDGYTQTGAKRNTQNLSAGDDAELKIVLSGANLGAGAIGLHFCPGSHYSSVQGLVINNFQGIGIRLENDGVNLVAGNFIGTDATGMAAAPNGTGIAVVEGLGSEIGGDSPGARNVISGNTGDGVSISGDITGFISVEGNYIGTTKDGGAALANNIGVNLFGFTVDNFIGCETENGDNVISGNTAAGIRITESAFNLVQGNRIGTDKAGALAVPNGIGVDLADAPFNAIGADGFGNLISGNTGAGVRIKTTADSSDPSSDNVIYGNKIGTNLQGLAAIPNDTGILIQDSFFNDIGSGDAADRNLISGNTHEGIKLENSDDIVLWGNFIGTDVTGTVAVPNGAGVEISGGTSNEVGCTFPDSGNVISGNTGGGVEITGSASGNFVQNNLIGLQVDGVSTLGNGGVGVEVYVGATNNVIGVEFGGGGTRTARDAAAKAKAGTNARTDSAASAGGGCSKRGASNSHDTKAFKAAQQMKAKAATLAQKSSEVATQTAKSGRAAKALAAAKVPAEAKVLAGSKVRARLKALAGSKALAGAKVKGTATVTKDGIAPRIVIITGANVIANNGEEGVKVSSPGDINNLISQNSIYANGKLGINLVGGSENVSGVTANDNGDGDPGANTLQNFPVITGVNASGGTGVVHFDLNTGANGPYTIEFFADASGCDPSGHGEGKQYLGSKVVSGSGSYDSDPLVINGGDSITATATDADGNTSEFSACFCAGKPATPTASNDGPYCEGGTIQLSTPTVPGATYVWTGPNGFAEQVQNPTRTNISTADAGTYAVTITVDGCASDPGTTNVIVNPTPATPTASNTGPYIEGQTIQLNTPAVAGATYAWTGPNSFTSALQNPTRANATTADAGNYAVTVTVDSCPSAPGTTSVEVTACPVNFTVNSTADDGDEVPGNGVCRTAATKQCTLRAAIEEANALTSCSTINIDFAIGSNAITLSNGQLTIDHNVNIVGPTTDSVTISGNNLTRLFTVNTGRTASIANLTLTGGNGLGGDGGAIQNNGTLTLNGVTLNGNSAINGGAIRSDGALVLINTTISGNTATGDGGGLYNAIAQATLTNVTVAYNRSDNDNNASGAGGGVFVASGNVLLHNTIVADNCKGASPSTTADNIGGTVDSSSSYNLIGSGPGGLVNGINNNQVGVATALLGALMNNGGPTFTHGLLYNSPALEAGADCVFDNTCSPSLGAALPSTSAGIPARPTETWLPVLMWTSALTNGNPPRAASLRAGRT
jgi:CSLREA domain-containing protein